MFSELNLDFQYRSDQTNILEDFYIPVLSHAVQYDRAVGYFTSKSLALVARGLYHFINNGGYMRLVASPFLSKEDIEAIKIGYKSREDLVIRSLISHLQPSENEIINQRLGYLAWLIAEERLEIKIALTYESLEEGIYHEKIGIFTDAEGNKIAFTGSANETSGGLESNFESIDVYCSWIESDKLRVERKIKDFEALWANQTKNVKTIEFPEAALKSLLKFKPHKLINESVVINNNPLIELSKPKISVPKTLQLREYQIEAIKKWVSSGGQGILEMATGTGKTITALTAAAKYYEKQNRLALIIVAPYIHLVEQWGREARKFGFQPILCYGKHQDWIKELSSSITSFKIGAINHLCVITTENTLTSDHMQESLKKLNKDTILIADEAHHLGAKTLSSKLPLHIKYRLGLSATPSRWYDEEGNQRLMSYFSSGIVFKFGLKEAIEQGYLTPYYYYPHIVYLTDEELHNYLELTRKIAKIYATFLPGEGNLSENAFLQQFLIKRSRILSGAKQKVNLLLNLLDERRDSAYNIVYCGDTKINNERQIDLITRLLGQNLKMKVHPFTAQEPPIIRHKLLKRFSEGDLQALVAIRCLDEGVDVPATQTAYILASSTNPREFIQRRGRVLRKYNNKKFAYIHDFIVVAHPIDHVDLLEPELFNVERQLLARELRRVYEFASLAVNGPEALYKLLEIRSAYNLLDLEVEK